MPTKIAIPEQTIGRPPVAVSSGVHAVAVLPRADPTHRNTMIAGTRKRVAFKPPTPVPGVLDEFKKFTRRWCEKNLKPLSPDTDLSFETWLEGTSYTEIRKDELRKKFGDIDSVDSPHWKKAKCFMKAEGYVDFKHARGIYSRTDEYKCLFGPVVKAIEAELYKHPAFIKHVPVKDRPAYIAARHQVLDMLSGMSDWTAMEANFTPDLMEANEFVLYEYMTQNLPMDVPIKKFENDLKGINQLCFKLFILFILCTRLSGEMNTSCGNGFCNLTANKFVHKRIGSKCVKPIVEGDDGIFRSAWNKVPKPSDYAELGIVVKCERVDKINTASFCGIVYAPEELICITNPLKQVAQLGIIDTRYRKSRNTKLLTLTRAKALSLKHMHPGCPILDAACSWILRNTGGFDVSSLLKREGLSMWERKMITDSLNTKTERVQCGVHTRQIMEEVYGVPIDAQIDLERYFDNLKGLQPIDHWVIEELCPKSWMEYSLDYGRVLHNYKEMEKDDAVFLKEEYEGFVAEFVPP